jgi:hypothetical protein
MKVLRISPAKETARARQRVKDFFNASSITTQTPDRALAEIETGKYDIVVIESLPPDPTLEEAVANMSALCAGQTWRSLRDRVKESGHREAQLRISYRQLY